MSWTMLWGRNTPEQMETDDPTMRFWPYWKARLKESAVKARVRCETALFILFLASGVILFWFPSMSLDRTTWYYGVGAFFIVFLVELCFVSPHAYAKSLAAKHEEGKRALTGRIGIFKTKSLALKITRDRNERG